MKNKVVSDKNKLIKRYLEDVKCKFYKQALGSKQRGRGIYVLYSRGKVYYVGLSKNSLRSRIKRHALSDRHQGKWNTFSFYQVGRTKYIKDIESLILRILKPKGNRIRGRFKKRFNLEKNFRHIRNQSRHA